MSSSQNSKSHSRSSSRNTIIYKKKKKKKETITNRVDEVSRYFISSLEKQLLYQDIIKQFIEWPPWQRRLILCRFTERTSCSLLSTLCTALEPIFHRDFEIKSKLGFHSTLIKTYVHSTPFYSNTKGQSPLPNVTNNLSSSCSSNVTTSNEIDYHSIHQDDKTVSLNSDNKYDYVSNEKPSPPLFPAHTALASTTCCIKNVSRRASRNFKISSLKGLNDDLCSENVDFTNLLKNQQGISHKHLPDRNSGSLSTMEFLKHSQKENTKRLGELVKPSVNDNNRLCLVGQYKHKKWWLPAISPEKTLQKASKRAFFKSFRKITDDFVHKYTSWSNAEKGDFMLNIVNNCSTDEVIFFANCIYQRLERFDDINRLGDRILLHIFSFLDFDDLSLAGQVCQRWKYLTSSAYIWENKCCQLAKKHGQLDVIRNLEMTTTVKLDWKQLYKEFKESLSILEHHLSDKIDDDIVVQSISSNQSVTDDDSKVMQGHGIGPTDHVTEVEDDKQSLISRISQLQNSIIGEGLECNDCRDGVIHNHVSFTSLEGVDTFEAIAAIESKDDMEEVYATESEMAASDKLVVALKKEKNKEEKDVAFDVRVRLVQAQNQIYDKVVTMSKPDQEPDYQQAVVTNIKTINRVRKLEGHGEAVLCLQFDSKRVMTGSSDRSIRLWDIRTGRFFHGLEGHQGGIRCLKFDEKYIVSGSWDTTVMIWDVVNFTLLFIITEHSDCVSCIEFTENTLITASYDNTICIFKKHTWKLLLRLQKHTAPVSCVTLLSEKQLLTGSHDKTLHLWDLDTYCVLRSFHGLRNPCLCVKVCGGLVAAGASDGTITFWNLYNSDIEGRILAHNGSVTALCFVEARFFSAGGDSVIREWDLSTCTCLRSLRGHTGPVLCLRASSKRVVSGSVDGTARIWDMTHKLQQVGGKYDALNTSIIQAQVLNEQQFKEMTISK